MTLDDYLKILVFLLPILSYLIGLARNKWNMPKPIGDLLANKAVMDAIRQGIADAQKMKDKTDQEKQEFARAWIRSELRKLLGDWLPDSTINFLIEQVIVKQKA